VRSNRPQQLLVDPHADDDAHHHHATVRSTTNGGRSPVNPLMVQPFGHTSSSPSPAALKALRLKSRLVLGSSSSSSSDDDGAAESSSQHRSHPRRSRRHNTAALMAETDLLLKHCGGKMWDANAADDAL
jgi:hypothetical protein